MDTPALVAAGILAVLYVSVRCLSPIAPHFSAFELARRLREDDFEAQRDQARGDAWGTIAGLRRLIFMLLALIIVVLLATVMNVILAVLVTLVFMLLVERLAGLRVVGRIFAHLYELLEPGLLRVAAYRRYLFFVPPVCLTRPEASVASEGELLHAVDGMKFLASERRHLIRSALEFTGLSVADAMSGRRSIHPVDKGEVLGPLLLDELYKTGKPAFVVTDGGLDRIVGILKLEKLTSLDLKDTPTALRAMSPDVHSIEPTAPVTEALAYLRSAKAPFLVVRDEDGKTVGLLTMDNILRCLFAD